jgi:predicted acylesterase/phospholipase RssA
MNYDLVFEGGGAKGMVFVGAMQEFEARGHTCGRLLGTSAGAITATLLAAGYKSDEMLAALGEQLPDGKSVFTSFMALPAPYNQQMVQASAIRAFLYSINLPLVPDFIEHKLDDAIIAGLSANVDFRHIFSFVDRGGWFSADNFLTWIRARLNSGSFNGKPRSFGDMTLQEFYEATRSDLSLVASDTTGKQMLVLNHITAPALPVAWATRMSMSIPLLWQEVIWHKEWGNYNGKDVEGHAIVDGGLLSNFPMELFLSDLKDVTSVMGDKVSQETIGFLIDGELDVPNMPQIAEAAGPNIWNLTTIQRISRLVDTTLSARDKMVIDSYSNLVVHMPAKGVGTTEFDMTEARRSALVAAGKQALKEYFTGREHPSVATGQDVSFGLGVDATPVQNSIDRIATKLLR